MQLKHALLETPEGSFYRQEEQEKKVVTVKNMMTGHEEKVVHRVLIEFLRADHS